MPFEAGNLLDYANAPPNFTDVPEMFEIFVRSKFSSFQSEV